jgi:hypothetical protein
VSLGDQFNKRTSAHYITSFTSKRVVRRVPSLRRGPASIVMACAGQIASHNLQAMQRSSPFGRLGLEELTHRQEERRDELG